MALPAILLSLIPSLVDKTINIIDKKFQTDAEKEEARLTITLAAQKQLQDAWDSEQAHLTERHRADMMSDSTLSKNIRPLVLLYLMALFTLAFFYQVPETVLEMLRDLLMAVFVFYFGSRTVEKVTALLKKG